MDSVVPQFRDDFEIEGYPVAWIVSGRRTWTHSRRHWITAYAVESYDIGRDRDPTTRRDDDLTR